MTPKRFDIYWVNLDPTVGHEIKKRRPGVIISPDELNNHLATVIIAPVTSVIRHYPFRLTVTLEGEINQVAVDQMRAVDKLRLCDKIGTLPSADKANLVEMLEEMFD